MCMECIDMELWESEMQYENTDDGIEEEQGNERLDF